MLTTGTNINDIKKDIEKVIVMIKHHKDDDYEMAYRLERGLMIDALESIGRGTCPDPECVAREVLKVLKIDYPRPYELSGWKNK